MTVANRLRGAVAVYVVALIAVALLYARDVQRTADSARELSVMAARVRATTDQLARLDQMNVDAEKYLATRDIRYRDKFAVAFREFGVFDDRVLQPRVLDSLRLRIQSTGAAVQEEMQRELAESTAEAKRAVRIGRVAAGGALILGLLLSVALVRSILGPLGRLAQGTRWVSAGRFDYRLETSGGDEFALVARDFNSMTERLAEVDRMKKDFVAKVSHDLKTPLSSMQETNSALLDHLAGPLTEKQRRLLELNVESGQRLSAMLGKLLDLSRVEAGVRPTLRVIDVNEIVRRCIDTAAISAARRGVQLSMPTTEPSLVVGDEGGIAQVIDNLVENAIKFSPPNGQVVVSVAKASEGEVSLTVTDDGPGIPPADRDRVFDRFYQADAGRGVRGRGVGLGLTICREIVSAHGGRIWVDENRPRGSAFHVVLRRGAAAVAGVMLLGAGGCASFHRNPPAAGPADLELRIASLTMEVDAVRARLDSTSAEADSLRRELQRLKEIDLKPRVARRPPTIR